MLGFVNSVGNFVALPWPWNKRICGPLRLAGRTTLVIAKYEAAVTIADRITRWLRQNRGAFCDECIAKQLALSRREQANRVARSLSKTSNFLRDRGTCSICGAERKVIGAV
jgi:hypothetical protein